MNPGYKEQDCGYTGPGLCAIHNGANNFLETWYGGKKVTKTAIRGWILARTVINGQGDLQSYTVLGTHVGGQD